MLYPGSISLREETFRALLTDVASSLKQHGFRHIIFLADSGGNVNGMKQVAEELEGIHDDFGISSIMMTVDPKTVRMKQRMAKNKLTINGVSLAPPKSIELGRKGVAWRADRTVEAIRKVTGGK
jgi:creatinine amidohydrolase/Fe(II)-dependent formamide hydrolase-like protein